MVVGILWGGWAAAWHLQAGPSPQEVEGFEPSAVRQVQISPDGSRVALRVDGPSPGVVVWQPGVISGSPSVGSESQVPGKFIDMAWAGDQRLITLAADVSGGLSASLWNPDGSLHRRFSPKAETWVRRLSVPGAPGSTLLLEGFQASGGAQSRGSRWLDVFQVSLETGASVRIARNPGDVVEWWADGMGQVRLALALEGRQQVVRMTSLSRPNAWVEVLRSDFVVDPVRVLGLSRDGGRAWICARLGKDTRGVHELDLSATNALQTVWSHTGMDFDGCGLFSSTGLKALTLPPTDHETVWLDPRWPEVLGPDAIPVALSFVGNRGLFYKSHWGGGDQFQWWYRDHGSPVTWESRIKTKFNLGPLGSQRTLRWRSSDGLDIEAFLTLPTSKSKPPLVTWVHGGPWAQEGWASPPEVDFLLRRGWAVLRVHYRGSTGRGLRFQKAGAGQWDKAVDDLLEGFRQAVIQGGVDADRSVIGGGSFGGFLTGMALARKESPYRAGVMWGAATDLPRWLREVRGQEMPHVWVAQREWLLGGKIWGNNALRIRPEGMRTPLLVVHGCRDEQVLFQHAQDWVGQLKQHHCPVEFLPLPHEGHILSTPAQQAAVWDQIEAFFQKSIR